MVWWVLRCILNTVEDVVKFMATAMWLKDTETPIKRPTGVEYRPRRFVHRTVSLDDMKLVKIKMKAVSHTNIIHVFAFFYLIKKLS